ncbi:MAG TPA: hypothetical protein PLX15_01920 [Candidatus Woesearchaeota archaeon]|jgi:transcription initiation factor TFIIE subunit alpha|nr:hypothetical protein [Candidatus Woesearchaeota archaeon]
MKLTQSFIERVVAESCGNDVIALVRFLKGKEKVSEFIIAEAIKEPINSLRNMLYRLQKVNLVDFSRKKDKKKGWYIYYWTFRPDNIKWLFKKVKEEQLERLNSRLEREKNNQFYSCQTKCMRLDFDQVANFNFKCPECGEIMYESDNSKSIKEIESKIKELKAEIKKVED